MNNYADVIIIGCGVLGSSIAYHLSKHGKSIIVLERGEIMDGTSNATAGRITMQDNTPRFFGEIAWKSYNNYKTLSEELDADLEYKVTGGMKLIYDKEGLKKAEYAVAAQQELGYDIELISRDRTIELEPLIYRDNFGAIYSKYDGQVSPFCLVHAYVKAAIRNGARIMRFTNVTGFNLKGNTITEVVTDRGNFAAGLIICAAGIYSRSLGEMLNISIPVHPERGCCLVSEKLPPILHLQLNCITQRITGNIIFGDTYEATDRIDRTTKLESIVSVARGIAKIVPSLTAVQIIRSYTGIRCLPDDGFPILGPCGIIGNFWLALCHNAFRLNAEIGPMMARMVLGESGIEEYPQLSYSRFANK